MIEYNPQVTEHSPPGDADAAALRKALVAAATVLTDSLTAAGIPDGVFLCTVFRASSANPLRRDLGNVEVLSNMPPDVANSFLRLLATKGEVDHETH